MLRKRLTLPPLITILSLLLSVLAHPPEFQKEGSPLSSSPQNVSLVPILLTKNQSSSDAQQAMDRGDALCATWKKASLTEAIIEYQEAATLWTSASDFSSASHAMTNSGDVYFVLSEYREALKQYQAAEALAAKSDDWLAKANVLSRMGRLQSFVGNNELAQQLIARALNLFKQHETNLSDSAANAYGEALGNLAEVSYARGDFMKAREELNRALKVFRNDPKGEAKVHLFSGYISGSIGDPEKAIAQISHSLELARQTGDKIGEGLALTTLGLSRTLKRDVANAVTMHNGALSIFREVGDRLSEGVSLNALGQAYESINDYSLAINQYEQALQLFEEIGAVDGMTMAAFKLGRMHTVTNNPTRALAFYERSLTLSRAAGKARTEAIALNEIAKVLASQGRTKPALKQYQKIVAFHQSIGDFQGQAITLNEFGNFLFQLGQKEKALEALRTALHLSEKAGEKGILVSTLYDLAQANLAIGSPQDALPLAQRALEIIEDLRANVASPDFRVSYLAGARKHYEQCINILMQLERLHPAQGFAAQALLVSEKGRARLLQDLVGKSGFRNEESQQLIERERELRGLFRVQAQYRMDLVLNRKDQTEIAAIDNQLAQLRAEYQQVLAQKQHQTVPRLEPSTALTLEKIQKELLSSDTMLLEYFLGDERSYLWAVTPDSIHAYELPSRKVIEENAREVYALMTARQETNATDVGATDEQYFEKATNLSRMLLGPLVEQLGSRRLLVVTEGALQHISLEALPDPVAQIAGTSLIEKNEVVVLPSVSTLMAIRNAPKQTSSATKLVAVLADPVFSAVDERVQNATASGGIALASSEDQFVPNQARTGSLTRLPYASDEADSISAAAPWGTTLIAKGFDASRETAMGQNVGQYQIVHFATHGFVDAQRPELSGIVLSKVDRDGKPADGLMVLQDIYNLDLSAELTVLSACQTALGKDVHGEGLVGLTHSFMSAGSKTVIASLWKVDDRATAVLMGGFYESMLQKGMAPSGALRAAKLKLIKEKRWSAPYYWAGFIVQGEYENRIAVAGHTWFRSGFVVVTLLVVFGAALLVIARMKLRCAPGK